MGSAPQMILTQETVTLDSKQPLATKNLGLTRARDLPNILLLMVDVAFQTTVRPGRLEHHFCKIEEVQSRMYKPYNVHHTHTNNGTNNLY